MIIKYQNYKNIQFGSEFKNNFSINTVNNIIKPTNKIKVYNDKEDAVVALNKKK